MQRVIQTVDSGPSKSSQQCLLLHSPKGFVLSTLQEWLHIKTFQWFLLLIDTLNFEQDGGKDKD
jgi:hypothetical protein